MLLHLVLLHLLLLRIRIKLLVWHLAVAAGLSPSGLLVFLLAGAVMAVLTA